MEAWWRSRTFRGLRYATSSSRLVSSPLFSYNPGGNMHMHRHGNRHGNGNSNDRLILGTFFQRRRWRMSGDRRSLVGGLLGLSLVVIREASRAWKMGENMSMLHVLHERDRLLEVKQERSCALYSTQLRRAGNSC